MKLSEIDQIDEVVEIIDPVIVNEPVGFFLLLLLLLLLLLFSVDYKFNDLLWWMLG